MVVMFFSVEFMRLICKKDRIVSFCLNIVTNEDLVRIFVDCERFSATENAVVLHQPVAILFGGVRWYLLMVVDKNAVSKNTAIDLLDDNKFKTMRTSYNNFRSVGHS